MTILAFTVGLILGVFGVAWVVDGKRGLKNALWLPIAIPLGLYMEFVRWYGNRNNPWSLKDDPKFGGKRK